MPKTTGAELTTVDLAAVKRRTVTQILLFFLFLFCFFAHVDNAANRNRT